MIALAKPDNILAMPTKSNEWYTPYRYVEAARTVMDGIELDPASSREANLIVRAERFYTVQDNGLEQGWNARSVWLNPPYGRENATGRFGGGRSLVTLWSAKLISEFRDGNVIEAILLMVADTDASWFQPLWEYPICFADHKIHFYRPGLPNMGQFFGTAFVYFGSNEQRFVEVFSQFGPVTKRISQPKILPINLSLWEVQ